MPTELRRHLIPVFRILPGLGALGITIRLFWNLSHATDLQLSDEASYLSMGSRFLHQGVLPTFQNSPLYAAWYGVHLAVLREPIVVYYAQLYSVVYLTAVLVYVYLRQIAVPIPLSLLATLLWIAQPAYITTQWTVGWPRPYHFAFLVFLSGATAIRGLKISSPLPLALTGTSFFLLAMGARAEYFVALLFFVGLMAISVAYRPRTWLQTEQRSYLWPMCIFVGTAILTVGMCLKGRVLTVSRFGPISRSWFAFGQHFSVYRLVKWKTDGPLNPWDDWEFIVGQTFPRVHSVLGAALANPSVFLKFELHNLIMAPRILCAYLVMPPYPVLKLLVLSMVVVFLAFFTSTSASARRRAFLTTGSALGLYTLSGAAAVIPGILITPKVTYSLPLLFVLFVGAVKWVSTVLEYEPAIFRRLVNVCSVLIALTFVVIPSPFDSSKGAAKPILSETAEIEAILAREGLGVARIFQIGGTGYSAFLEHGLSETVEFFDRNPNERFWDFVQREHIDAILVDDRLRNNREYRDDADFASLLGSPDRFGWVAERVGTQGDVFYLRNHREER